MDIYVFIGLLISGTIGFILALIEVRIIHLFIVKNQGLEGVPLLDTSKNYSSKDFQIRKLRRLILSRKNRYNQNFVSIRKKILIMNILSISFFLIFGTGVAYLYFTSR